METILRSIAVYSAAVCLGFLSGRLVLSRPETVLTHDMRTRIPIVEIRGVQNGLLHGKIEGNARVVLGTTVLTQSGIFAIDASALLRNEISVVVPTWAQFVASKKGKKYYPVMSANGQKISPVNRIYFLDAIDAENAGYES